MSLLFKVQACQKTFICNVQQATLHNLRKTLRPRWSTPQSLKRDYPQKNSTALAALPGQSPSYSRATPLSGPQNTSNSPGRASTVQFDLYKDERAASDKPHGCQARHGWSGRFGPDAAAHPQQAQAAQTALQEQLGMQARGVSEQFGPVPVPVEPRREQFMPQTSGVLPGAGCVFAI